MSTLRELEKPKGLKTITPSDKLHRALRRGPTMDRYFQGEIYELINRGIETKGSFGETALMLACKKHHPELVHALLENGADINASNTLGFTPLMFAAMHGKDTNEARALVSSLLDKGADPKAKNCLGDTASQLARSAGKPMIASDLAYAEYNAQLARASTVAARPVQQGAQLTTSVGPLPK